VDILGLCIDIGKLLLGIVSATDAVVLYSIYVYLVSIALLAVACHRQGHIFRDFSIINFKFPDFSMFSRMVATL